MARHCNATDFMGADTAAATAVPITVCGWFKPGTDLAQDWLFALVDKDVPDHVFAFRSFNFASAGNHVLQSIVLGSGGFTPLTTTNVVSLNSYNSACARFKTTSDRDIILNGDFANKGSESATTNIPAGIDRTNIGSVGDSTPGFSTDVDLAEFALWNAVLTDEEVTAFDKGYSPWSIRPASLQHYWRLLPSSASTEPDEVGGLSLTRVSSPAIADHVPIMEPFRRSLSLPSPSAGITIPLMYHHYSKNIGAR